MWRSFSCNYEVYLETKQSGPFLHPFIQIKKLGCLSMVSSLRASTLGHSGGGVGKGRRAGKYVSGIWIPPPIPLWLPVNWAVRFLPISTNVNKHWKTCAKGNDVITNVISVNQHFFRINFFDADIQIPKT